MSELAAPTGEAPGNGRQARAGGAPFGEAERYLLMDSGRGIAAVLVLSFHVLAAVPPTADGSLPPLATHIGYIAITILFLISGFLLYRPFVVRRTRGGQPPVGPYAIRRALRILPAYWFALTLVVIFGSSVIGATVRADPLFFYGFGQVYDSDTVLGGIGQAWTLCVEITFYIFLPIYALLVTVAGARRQSYAVEAAGVVVLVLVAAAFTTWLDPGSGLGIGNGLAVGLATLPRFLGQFAIGMGLAAFTVWIDQRGSVPHRLRLLYDHPSLTWLIVPPLYSYVALYPPPLAVIDLINVIIAAAIVWPAIVGIKGRGVAGRVLGTRLLLYLGVVSYGFYLYHYAVVSRVSAFFAGIEQPGLRFVVVLLVSFGGALVAGMFSWYLIERPGVRFAHRFRKKPTPVSSPTIVG